jgi:uncharacterized membrane protein
VALWLTRLLALAAVGWVVVLLGAPFLPSPLSALAYAFGSLICHQMPERSFHLRSFQLPVCARCMGLYSGAAVGAVWAGTSGAGVSFAAGPARRRLLMTGLAAIPTLATVAMEWAGVWTPSNAARAVAGAPLGFAVTFVVMGAMRPTLHYE